MVLLEEDRRKKLMTVAKALGYESVFPMLNVYKERDIVPGICTRFDCDYITNVDRNGSDVLCGNCRHRSVQSILVIARLV